MTDYSFIDERHYETVREFLEALNITNNEWVSNDTYEHTWIFRGQREAEWKLLPSAYRAGVEETGEFYSKIKGKFKKEIIAYLESINSEQRNESPLVRSLDTIEEAEKQKLIEILSQTLFEWNVIENFTDFANSLGYSIPDFDKFDVFDYKGRIKNIIEHFCDPQRSVYGIYDPQHQYVALAQHHGIPTVLMDFTKNSLKAAFFAAQNVQKNQSDGNLSVWAIDADLLIKKIGLGFQSVRLERSTNSYLHHQDGISVYYSLSNTEFKKTGQWLCFEDILSMNISRLREFGRPLIRKFTLPKAQAGELLRLLQIQGISRAHLMPTYDNITESLRTKWRWLE